MLASRGSCAPTNCLAATVTSRHLSSRLHGGYRGVQSSQFRISSKLLQKYRIFCNYCLSRDKVFFISVTCRACFQNKENSPHNSGVSYVVESDLEITCLWYLKRHAPSSFTCPVQFFKQKICKLSSNYRPPPDPVVSRP